MKILIGSLAILLSLASCSYPTVKTIAVPPQAGLSMSTPFAGISQQIAAMPENGRVVILFVHGMGDHCPGYALNERLGWFSSDVVKALGLSRDNGTLPKSNNADAPERLIVPDFENEDSKSTLVMQRYRYTVDNTNKHVDAVEITWSGLDRWLKDVQLGYDMSDVRYPSPPPKDLKKGDDILDCVDKVGGGFKEPRVVVNKAFKDGLLDRNLSDAVVYAGSYGPKIERETADALCRLLRDDWAEGDTATRCIWPVDPEIGSTRFVFVTHSLGSRIAYDTILELSKERMRPNTAVFTDDEINRAAPSIKQLLANTTAIYMMANQLPLLGLANARPTMNSHDGGVRLMALSVAAPASSAQPAFVEASAASRWSAQRSALRAATQAQPDEVLQLAIIRRDAIADNNGPTNTGTLDIVAFSDPNDLLSYSIPDWYASASGELNVRVTNVFVHNAPRWLWLVENPSSAHTNYMINDDVWKAIACGAVDGAHPACTDVSSRR